MDINIQLDAGDVTQGTDSAIRGLERIRSLINGLEPVGARLARDSRGELDGVLAKARTAVNQLHSDMGKLQRAMSSMDPKQLRETLQDANTKMTGLLTQVDKLRRTSWVGAGAEEAQRKIRALTTEVQVTVTEYGKMTLAATSAPAAAATAAAGATQRVVSSAKATTESIKEVKRELRELEQQTLRAANGAKLLSPAALASGQWKFNQAAGAGAFREQSAATFVGPIMPDAVSRGRAAAAAKEEADATRAAASAAKELAKEKALLAAGSDNASAAMKRHTISANDLHSAYRGLASGFGAMWLTWGNVMPLLAGAGISHAVTNVVKTGMAVEKVLSDMAAMADIGTADMQRLTDVTLEMGSKSVYGPLQVAEALKVLALAGKSTEESLAALPTVLDFAKVGDVKLDQAASMLIAVGTAYGYQANELAVVSDVIAKTAASSMAEVSAMAESFRSASVVATQFGVDLRETAKGLGLLAQIGIQGSAAGTAFRQFYAELTGGSKAARQAMKEMGVEVFNLDGTAKGLREVVTQVATAMEGLSAKQQNQMLHTIANERGFKQLAAVLQQLRDEATKSGTGMSSFLQRLEKDIEQSAGYTALKAAEMGQTTEQAFKRVGAELEGTFASAFRAVQPYVENLAVQLREAFADPRFLAGITEITRALVSLATVIVENATVIGALAGAYVAARVGMAAFHAVSVLIAPALTAIGATATAAAAGTTTLTAAAAGLSRAFWPVAAAVATATAAYMAWKALTNSADKDAAIKARSAEELIGQMNKRADEAAEKSAAIRRGASAAAAENASQMRSTMEEALKGYDVAAAKHKENLAGLKKMGPGYETEIKAEERALEATYAKRNKLQGDFYKSRNNLMQNSAALERATEEQHAKQAKALQEKFQVKPGAGGRYSAMGGGGGGGGGRKTANPANDELRQTESLQAWIEGLKKEAALLDAQPEKYSKLTEKEKELELVRLQLASTTDATGRAYTAQEKATQKANAALLEEGVALEKSNKAKADAAKAIEKIAESTKSWNQSMDQTLDGLRAQVEAHGKSKEAVEAATLARMEEAKAAGTTIKVGRDVIAVTEEEIEKQKEKLALMQELNFLQIKSDIDKSIRDAERSNRQSEASLRTLGMTNLERAKANALLQIQFTYEEKLFKLREQLDQKSITPAQYNEAVAAFNAAKLEDESAAVNKVIREDFAATANSINSSLTDAIMRSMEDGKGFGSNMAKALKAEFKKLVLQPTISFIMQPISNMLGGLVQGLMRMVMGGGSGGIGGSGIGLGDIWNGASSLWSAYQGDGITGALGQVGSWLGLGSYGATSGAATAMAGANFSGAAVSSAGLVPAAGGGAAGAGGGLAGIAGGLAMVAIPLIVGAIIESNSRDRAGGAAFATSDWRKDPTVAPGGIDMNIATGQMPAFEDMVTRMQELGYGDDPAWLAQFKGNERAMYAMMRQMEARERGEYGEHQALPNAQDLIQMYGGFYQGQGYADPQSMGWWNWKDVDYASIDPKVIEASRKLSVSIVDTLTQTARALGQDADFRVTTGWANRGKGKLWGAAQIMRDGQEVAGFNRSDYKDTQHYMQAVFSSTMDAFRTFDLPQWATNLVDTTQAQIDALEGDRVGEEAAALYQQASQNIVQTLNAIKTLIDVFPDFAGLTQDTVYAIGEAMGGIENLNSKYASYIQNFYSDQERADLARKQVSSAFEQAGLTMPATREQFRAMVEALDLTTEAGRTAFATMMGLADSFAQITADGNSLMVAAFEGAQQLAGVIREGLLGNLSAQQVGEQMADIVVGGIYNAIAGGFANQITQMMMEGVITPMLQAAVAGTSITEAVSQAAIDKMIADATAAANALGQLLNSEGFQSAMQGIQSAMMQLAPQITAPRPYYTSYAQRNEQAQAAAEAAQRARDEAQRAAQQAADEAARKQKEIENERLGLLKTLLQMEGYQEALRQAELNGLDESNRALQERIWALQDAAEAEAKHAAALKEAEEFFGGFSKSISEFIFNTKMGQTQDPAESYRMAAGKFSAQMSLARGGDREALTGITGYASSLIDSIKRESSSSQEANLRIARVLGQLGELPRVLSAEELIVKAVDEMKNTLSGVLISNFDMLDTTMDGALSFAELQASGLASDAQIRAMIARIDVNGDGMISKTEAVRAQAELTKLNVASVNTGVNSVNTSIGTNTSSTSSWLNSVNSGVSGVNSAVGNVTTGVGGTNSRLDINNQLNDFIRANTVNLNGIHDASQGIRGNTSTLTGQNALFNSGGMQMTVRAGAGWGGGGGGGVYAKGGVFTNSVVHRPTAFSMGLMGEAGSEAIMPLGRTAGGQLGVHVLGGEVNDSDLAIIAELRAMREELRAARSDARASSVSIVRATKEAGESSAKTARVLEDWDRNGSAPSRDPMKVEVVN